MDLEAAGEAFKILATHLRTTADGELQRELYRALNDAAKPIIRDIRDDLPRFMPRRYAAALGADLNMSLVRRTGKDPGVSIRVTARPYETSSDRAARRSHTGRKVAKLNSGLLSHPVFGDREDWKTQEVRKGFVTRTAERQAPEVRDAILAAMNRIAGKVTGKL